MVILCCRVVIVFLVKFRFKESFFIVFFEKELEEESVDVEEYEEMTLVLLLELEMDNLFDLGDSDVVRLENYEELWFMEFFEVLSVFFGFFLV